MTAGLQADGSGFTWDVALPERGGGGSFCGSRPKAQVFLTSAGKEESWAVPVAVGRRLKLARQKNPACFGSRAELAYAVKELQAEAGRARVEALVNKRDYSKKELLDKLLADGYSSASAQALVERAAEAGVIDDARFASAWARSKVAAGWGRSRIERELCRKGVDASCIPGWPEEFLSEEDERERAFQIASRRRLTGKNDFQKIVRHLCSKGYATSVAVEAAKRALR